MNVFSPRSLDVDVVLDLMIHDVDIVLALTARRTAGDPRRRHFDPFAKRWTSPTCGCSFPTAAWPT